ncbi:MAG: hypothetical protein LH615_12560 [Ferruginibacter sp.]|nr:hypothetical protein [Ferruginibacter sp.]
MSTFAAAEVVRSISTPWEGGVAEEKIFTSIKKPCLHQGVFICYFKTADSNNLLIGYYCYCT